MKKIGQIEINILKEKIKQILKIERKKLLTLKR